MKNKITLTALVAIVIGFTSCAKDYTCTCTATSPTGTASSYSVTNHTTKKAATKACDDSARLSTTGTTCVLK